MTSLLTIVIISRVQIIYGYNRGMTATSDNCIVSAASGG